MTRQEEPWGPTSTTPTTSTDESLPAKAPPRQLRAAQGPARTHAVRACTPPWRPIRISDVEWIIMRDSTTEPVGVIRVMKMGPREETFFRVVTWAETSQARSLVGYFLSLAEADRSIRFTPTNPVMPDIRLASGWGPMTPTSPQP